SSPVVVVFGEIRLGLVTVTVAPLTAAPFGSLTSPSTEPVVLDCPIASTGDRIRPSPTISFRILLIRFPFSVIYVSVNRRRQCNGSRWIWMIHASRRQLRTA